MSPCTEYREKSQIIERASIHLLLCTARGPLGLAQSILLGRRTLRRGEDVHNERRSYHAMTSSIGALMIRVQKTLIL
jgi:hypothetical protein